MGQALVQPLRSGRRRDTHAGDGPASEYRMGQSPWGGAAFDVRGVRVCLELVQRLKLEPAGDRKRLTAWLMSIVWACPDMPHLFLEDPTLCEFAGSRR